ncbi:Pycsar system effector family protein [Flavihumibacter petaseus]|uniref:HD/PDEase domain-containing protein n=1 Tax=Flavihumibacter petaseus NBRC 106054 TaxID=1220578 RepID=A0A0E9MZT6_9BACT|nr:Pycsar system effector family protein [Flavihumibacter petaseus]GAO42886.1 hypothetical protein FPE01S_01_19040 [Flavihumibacter petaseus NBRC 106054]
MEPNGTLIDAAELFVRQLFEEQIPAAYYYHDLRHTTAVVTAAETIAARYDLSSRDREALMIAAWFHDTGYSRTYMDHEAASMRIASDFLRSRNAGEDLIQLVSGCIRATKMPQSPQTLIEEILCDSDLFHLGTEDFTEDTKLLRKELNTAFGKDIGKKNWRKANLEFLQGHHYYTSFARQNLEPGKQRNIDELLAKISPGDEPSATPVTPALVQELREEPPVQQEPLKKEKEKDPEKKDKDKGKLARTERGIATMFRIMSDNHVSLSQMADSKANIMISVNTIVLSILVSVLLGKLQYYPQFIIPTIILATSCLGAVVFAIMATRPNVTKGVFAEEDIRQKKVNLLFFGNFFKMQLADYEWAMTEMMNDSEYLYGSMIKDIYYLGKVLARKYRFLRIAYNVFMFGLIISILAFGIAGFVGSK